MAKKTELNLMGTPGKIHSFSAKTPSVSGHSGLFTYLSPMATAGRRYAFSAKTPSAAVAIVVPWHLLIGEVI
jgi:hypothetical protein